MDGALADAEQLIKNSQELVRAHLMTARILRRQGNVQAADEHKRLALASPPKSARDYVYLGTAQVTSDREAAQKNFQHAWELSPKDPEAIQALAYLSMELKIDDSALKWLDLWVAAAPQKATPLASRAVFYARQGKLELGRADCEAALKLRPSPREQVQVASALILIADKTESADQKQMLINQSLALLVKAIHSEWKLIAEVAQDADMQSLRNDSRFQTLVKTAMAFGKLSSLVDPNDAKK